MASLMLPLDGWSGTGHCQDNAVSPLWVSVVFLDSVKMDFRGRTGFDGATEDEWASQAEVRPYLSTIG